MAPIYGRERGWGGRVLSLYLLRGVRPDTFEEFYGWICLEEGLTSLRSWPE